MKKLFGLVLVTLLIVSCKKPSCGGDVDDGEFSIKRIDGCQYLIHTMGRKMAHKGNCDNPYHLQVRETKIKARKEDRAVKEYHKEKLKRLLKVKKALELKQEMESTYKELDY